MIATLFSSSGSRILYWILFPLFLFYWSCLDLIILVGADSSPCFSCLLIRTIVSLCVSILCVIRRFRIGVKLQFRSVQDGIYTLGKAHLRSTISQKFSGSAVFETVSMLTSTRCSSAQAESCYKSHVKRRRAPFGNTTKVCVCCRPPDFTTELCRTLTCLVSNFFVLTHLLTSACTWRGVWRTDEDIETLPYSAYFSDLASSDFLLFPDLKKCLAELRFNSRSPLGSAISQCLSHLLKIQFKQALL